jgi:hypothetical protein
MTIWIGRLLALIAAASLALPPGWCCGLIQPRTPKSKSEPRPHRCCAHVPRPAKQDPKPAPCPPVPRPAFCCRLDIPLPGKPQLRPDISYAAEPVSVAAAYPTVERPALADGLDFIGPSPPLQILHCVWLC